jgi:cytochrome c-type biogenesis protein CcmH/NrfG
LKADATINAQLSSIDEIRADQWQGSDFIYPNIRVRLISNRPLNSNCNMTSITLGIQVYSEQDSEQEADRIAGIINNVLHGTSFIHSGIQIALTTTNLVPAIRSDARTWRSEVLMSGTAGG